jgi:predicted ATP-grasp superfamily ATP-dependent carboligase
VRIAEVAGRECGTLVLPLTERTTLPVSACRDLILTAGGRLVLPDHATVLRAFDKHQTTRLAESLGIAVPRTQLIHDHAEAIKLASEINYPVVMKPCTSEEVCAAGQVRATGAPVYAQSPGEFLSGYEKLGSRCSRVLAQEFVEGSGSGYFALMRHGELRAEFAHQRLRDVRPTGSGSSLRMSIEPDPKLREAGLAILQALRWHGVAMVEFRIRPDGTPVFLEVNGRFWISLALAVYAGADFPALLADLEEHGDVGSPPPYQIGLRCRWLLGDVRHLISVWRGKPSGYTGPFPGRLRTFLDFFTLVRGTYHDNFTMDDPLPELGDWLDFLFRRVPGHLRKRHLQKESYAQRRYSHS